jgi:outer membrane protein OmpA-like peptidoglycan-associated protein
LVERIDNSIQLSGEVPSIEEHDRILGVAGQHFEAVTNSLSITNESAGSNYGQAADQALAVVSHLTSGTANWSGSALTVDGSANADAVAKAREQFGALGSESMQGAFNVRSLLGSQQCNTDFDELLSNATIRFQTGSATIDAGNDDLLSQLADLAISCPGTLIVEGHTDNRGDAAANQSLSLARANAVRDALASRGIETDRLAAKGLGEAQPIADNDTSTGRAKNRRIAITIGDAQ